MIRVVLPYHLCVMARVDGEVKLEVPAPVTIGSVLDVLEAQYPALQGAIREHVTKKRRALVRFYACGEDWSHEGMEKAVPERIVKGEEPLLIVGAIAGG